MSVNHSTEQRSGPRYMIKIPVSAEWDDERSGEHVVVEGETENVGPQGALVHLEKLPDVGSRVRLTVPDAQGTMLQTVAEVLRLERNPAQPLAALQVIDATDEWRGLVWEPAAERVLRGGDEDYDEYEH
ncbi:MAG: PilZ domain-containing protein [Acidobacteriota bacterium]|nr:PilZ domain-containing protein [Acidobacteriota bacterium]